MPSTPPTREPSAVLEPGTIVAERYRVEALLGEGAVGAVYHVKHLHMGKDFAMKLLRAELGEDEEEIATRFQREAVAASRIDHVNVAAATDFGRTAEGRFFLVLEYVPGQTLRQLIAQGPVRAHRAIGIALQIARALVKAHGLGIIHRDLKPENVMLIARDGGDLVKILDFGIAKVPIDEASRDAPAMTRLGMIYGTPGYMAPEQALGEVVDARADLYALGMILYEMLAAVPPFPSDDAVAILGMQVSQRAPALRERAPSIAVPVALEAIVMRLLETSASDRYQTAADVVAALESVSHAALSHQPTVAVPAVLAARENALVAAGRRAAAWAAPHARRAIALAKSAYAKLRASLPEQWRPAAPAIVIAAAAMSLLAFVLPVAIVASRGGGKKMSISSDGGARAEPEYKAAPSASMRQAMRGGPLALEDLARDFPDDPRIQRELVRAYTADGRGAPAMRALARLLAIEPDAARDDEMNDALTSALYGANDAAAAALRVAEGPFGARGVDILIECATRTGPMQERCTQSLSKPDVRRHASPAALALLDLREAKECDAKRAAAERTATQGDARSLAELKTLSKRYGCGKRGRYDCWPCLRKDGFLDDVVARVEARSRRADVVDP